MGPIGVCGISFDHMHMGDLLREVDNHPSAFIAGIYDPDPARMEAAVGTFGIPRDRVFTDLDACLEATRGELAVLCSATADHANYVERLAKSGLHILVEKPFASSVSEARRMMAVMAQTDRSLAINWPVAWFPCHNKAKALIEAGMIGDLIEVHYYGGNRGPLYHLADKIEVSAEEVEREKPNSWWYRRGSGGGSLLDYLGYGATLGTWFMDGLAPIEVTCVVDEPLGLEVDEHSVTVCRYATGLSKLETRWGTFTDPWIIQPQPRCGFILVGTDGTISSFDYDDFVTIQTRAKPESSKVTADALPEGRRGAVEYMIAQIESGGPIEGPLNPDLCLTAQRIVDTARKSAELKMTLALLP